MRNALQYKDVIKELFDAIEKYRSEIDNPILIFVHFYRNEIFRLYDEIKSMGKASDEVM